jgi:FKBP-type peptidyl-prolyl cis-trans isomerase FklB
MVNRKFLLAVMTLGLVVLQGCQGEQSKELDMQSDDQKVAYSIGLSIGGNFKNQGLDLDPAFVNQGIVDALADNEPKLNEAEMQEVMMRFQQAQMEKMQAKQGEEASMNAEASAAFLAENAGKEGVVTTDSGLQYKVITEGTGATPSATDTVEVHYRGTLIDGTEFDSSYRRGETVSFPVNGVIAGWTEALQLMQEGAKYELYIPSDLAYGPGGTGGPIGPNQALIFEVELVSVAK